MGVLISVRYLGRCRENSASNFDETLCANKHTPLACVVLPSQVFSPASEPHLMLLADSAARAAAADAAGEQVPPEHSREVRVQQFVQVGCG